MFSSGIIRYKSAKMHDFTIMKICKYIYRRHLQSASEMRHCQTEVLCERIEIRPTNIQIIKFEKYVAKICESENTTVDQQ